MITREVTINNQVGLHARPATFFIQKANEFKSVIWVEKDDRRVNAKSLLGVLSLGIVKGTTIDTHPVVNKVIEADDILAYQRVIRRMPVPDNVCEYAVRLSSSTRPGGDNALATQYLSWGAGPRASQYLVMGAKTHAALQGKYSPDIEDVQAVATEVLRHRIVRNYYAEAENIAIETLVEQLLQAK